MKTMLMAVAAASLSIAPALAQDTVTAAPTAEAFKDAFCATARTGENIFVLPAAMFSAGDTVACSEGTYTLRMSEPADDPGHMVLNVDPPSGVADAFDCDGKADSGMTMVAINCIPVSAETTDHTKT